MQKVKSFKESKGKVRFLNEQEEISLLEAASEPLRTVILAGIYAGVRVKSEALTLTWDNIDFENGFFTVRDIYAKSGETRSVPLDSGLREALWALKGKARGEHYVFTKANGKPYRAIGNAFAAACRNAKLLKVTPHTLRHTFASRLAMAGVDLRTIQELGGWRNLKMVERYTHLVPDHKVAAIQKLRDNVPDNFTTQAEQAKERELQAA